MPMRKEIDRMGPLNFKGINIDSSEYFHKNIVNKYYKRNWRMIKKVR